MGDSSRQLTQGSQSFTLFQVPFQLFDFPDIPHDDNGADGFVVVSAEQRRVYTDVVFSFIFIEDITFDLFVFHETNSSLLLFKGSSKRDCPMTSSLRKSV